MAGSYIVPRDSLGGLIAGLQAKIEQQATSPMAGNQTIAEGAQVVTDNNGRVLTATGEYQWPTAPWAGNIIYGQITFNGTGNPIVVVGLQPDGLYGLGIYDSSGNRVTLLGQQPTTGNYGLSILNQAGVLQQVGGTLVSFGASLSSVTSTSYVATTASITCNLGTSGQALATWNCTIQPFAGGYEGDIGLFVDGTFYSGALSRAGTNTTPSTGGGWSISGTALVSSTSGNHTFNLRVAAAGAGGSTVSFVSPTLFIQPL